MRHRDYLEDRDGTPKEMGELFILHNNRREAKAVLLTHQLGWEVRLMIGAQAEVVQSQVCRTQEEVFDTGEKWEAAMIEKGWRTMDTDSDRGKESPPNPDEEPLPTAPQPLDRAPVAPLTEPEDTEGG